MIEGLKVMVLRALALQARGDGEEAVELLAHALALAEPGGSMRLFIDEGTRMEMLLSQAAARGIMPEYVARILTGFRTDALRRRDAAPSPATPLSEPLSPREREVLRLVAMGLSNEQIGERLFLSLSTVKGHNLRIFDKLQVKRRTEAVARARELGLL